jgi:3-phosphoshikimate 1-carboxyvinyltransferase
MQGAVHVSDRQAADREPIATLTSEPCEMRGVHVEASEIPHMVDEVPVLAALAARAVGETRIEGAGELRVKETDRLKSLAANLRAIGVHAEEVGDALIIEGSDKPLRGTIVTGGDHRIAMAFGILGSLPGNGIEIDDVACVDVSFPGFWQQLRACAP